MKGRRSKDLLGALTSRARKVVCNSEERAEVTVSSVRVAKGRDEGFENSQNPSEAGPIPCDP